MPTRIVFAIQRAEDRPLAVRVSQGPDDVFSEWKDAKGLPFALERDRGGGRVYINPATIAYWEEAPTASGAATP
jgi:hypothetical protein